MVCTAVVVHDSTHSTQLANMGIDGRPKVTYKGVHTILILVYNTKVFLLYCVV